MVAITVLKNNVPTGPFTREQVTEQLQAGEFTLESLAFIEGLSQWTPLREVLAKVDGVPAVVSLPPSAPPVYSYAATMQPPEHLMYGGFWIRFAAYLLDGAILGIPLTIILVIICVIIGGATAALGGTSSSSGHLSDSASTALGLGIILAELVIWVICIVLGWLYFAKLESGPEQGTYGKRIMGLKVTNMSGARISFGHASGRFFWQACQWVDPFRDWLHHGGVYGKEAGVA